MHGVRLACCERAVNGGAGVRSGVFLVLVAICGCTRESLRVALEAQQRADQVQNFVFEKQHEALGLLLYRDLIRRLERAGPPLTAAQRSALNEVWNQRDLIEFWRVQHERAKALRLAGVDARLYSRQSIVDLLYKSLRTSADRARQGVARQAAAQAGARVGR